MGPRRKFVVYYESTKRELKTRSINECRCDERPKTKAEESTHFTYTGLLVLDTSSRLKISRKTAALARVMPTFPLRCEENVVWWKWTILCFPEHWVVWVGV
jgi:hypothetical protein